MKSELYQDGNNTNGEGPYTSQGSQTAFKVTSEYSLFTSSVNPFAINLNNMAEEEENNSVSQTSTVLKLDDDSIQDADRDCVGEKLAVSGRLPTTKVPYLGYRRTKTIGVTQPTHKKSNLKYHQTENALDNKLIKVKENEKDSETTASLKQRIADL